MGMRFGPADIWNVDVFARTDPMDHLPKPDDHRITAFSSGDRRRAVRVELCGELHAQAAALDLPVLLLDFSKTGFSIHSTFDFMVDSTHDFRFTPAADPLACMILTARVVHTTVRHGGNRKPSYVVGLEFMDRADERVDFAIRSLLAILAVAGAWSDADGAD
jgi:PilZ domain